MTTRLDIAIYLANGPIIDVLYETYVGLSELMFMLEYEERVTFWLLVLEAET